jgi:hypothetical protein
MQLPFTQVTSPGRVIMSVFVLSRRVWPNECRLKTVLLTLPVSQYSQALRRARWILTVVRYVCKCNAPAATQASPSFVFTTAVSLGVVDRLSEYALCGYFTKRCKELQEVHVPHRKTLALWLLGGHNAYAPSQYATDSYFLF